MVFVLDSSGSVSSENFELVKNFTKNVLRQADIDGGSVRVGVNVYSDDDQVAFNLNTYSNKADVFNAIDALQFTGGGTETGRALETMRSEMFTVANGDRPEVDNFAIVITDGKSDDRHISVADAARDDGINIFAIGIGAAEFRELARIANKPSAQNVFTIKDVDVLAGLHKKVCTSVCSKSIIYCVFFRAMFSNKRPKLILKTIKN